MGEMICIKRGDLEPALSVQLRYRNQPINLTGLTVSFRMKSRETGIVKVDSAAATVVDATTGKVKYVWTAGDTDTEGHYLGEFVINHPGSRPQTVPQCGHIAIDIEPNAGD